MSDKAEAPSAPTVAPKSKAPLLLGLNSLLLAGLLAAFFLRGSGHATAEPAEKSHAAVEAAVGSGPTVRLGDFTVRLRNPEADRYVRVAFELEVPTEKEKLEITNRGPQTRDVVIAYLSDRTVDDMRGGEALERMKQELLRRLAAAVPAARIRALYLTEFVVQ